MADIKGLNQPENLSLKHGNNFQNNFDFRHSSKGSYSVMDSKQIAE
jgi:hypothetical protein